MPLARRLWWVHSDAVCTPLLPAPFQNAIPVIVPDLLGTTATPSVADASERLLGTLGVSELLHSVAALVGPFRQARGVVAVCGFADRRCVARAVNWLRW